MNNIDEASFFSKELLAKADMTADSSEPLWKRGDMDAVIDTFEKNGKVLLGLDIFLVESGAKKVIGYPNFSNELKNIATHEERCRLSARLARASIENLGADANIRLTVTWDD